jgi:hypothetical protein
MTFCSTSSVVVLLTFEPARQEGNTYHTPRQEQVMEVNQLGGTPAQCLAGYHPDTQFSFLSSRAALE